MNHSIVSPNYPSRSKDCRSRRPFHCRLGLAAEARGYALVAAMIMVTALLISLTAALPSVYQAGQREREEETVFRAEQYERAIYLFHGSLGRYPTSVKELLNANDVRYLRQPYRDPLAPNGRWRFIHANAAGMLIDSLSQDQTVSATSSSPESTAASLKAEEQRRKQAEAQCNSRSDSDSDATYQTGRLLGAFIAGLAPCSDQQSIRVLNKANHYDEWEFLAVSYVQYNLPSPQTASAQPGNTAQPGSPNQNLPGSAAPGSGFQSGSQPNFPSNN